MNHCPLCHESTTHQFYRDNKRIYLRCSDCGLISVPDEYLLSANDEKAQYDLHQNDPEEPGYQKFLSRALEPLLTKVDKDAIGLDFGCGPAPAISKIGEQHGIKISNYDLYYFDQRELLQKQYDFVIMTEVIEHIADPKSLLKLLVSLMKPKAILAIMTKRVLGLEQFKNWHYKNDPTHIRFYSIETFEWIAQRLNWQLDIIDKDVVFYYKN